MADPMEPRRWRKSSFSDTGDCVEFMLDPPMVRVRNSNDVDAGELQFNYSEWTAFIKGVAAGEAELPF